MITGATVSVVLPTYNRGWIIREAIDSVLAQTYKDFELIVVDDGSEDHTVSILDSYGDKIRVIRRKNGGVSAARNTGIHICSGRLIAFLDSDDTWAPEKLEKQVSFFHRNPQAQICQTQEIWIRNGKLVNPRKRHKKLSGMIFEPSLSLCLVSPSAVMLTRRLIEQAGFFDENLPACEDYDLWLRIGCKHPVYLIDEKLTFKRGGHNDQLSKNPMLDKYRILAIRKLLDQGQLTQSQRQAAIAKLKEKCMIYAGGCSKRGREKEAGYYRNLADRYKNR